MFGVWTVEPVTVKVTILFDLMGEQEPLVDRYNFEWKLHVKIKEMCRGSTDHACLCK